MDVPDSQNPVLKVMAHLDLQWQAFLKTEQPVFRWLSDGHGLEFVENWYEYKNELVSADGNLYVVLKTPMTSADQFLAASQEEFFQNYEVAQKEAPELKLGWTKPALGRNPETWLDFFASFCRYHPKFPRLCLVFVESATWPMGLAADFVAPLMKLALGKPLRFVLFDRVETPIFSQVSGLATVPFAYQPLAMIKALNELLPQDKPDNRFRQLILELQSREGGVEPELQGAVALCQKQGWLLLEAVAHLVAAIKLQSLMQSKVALEAFDQVLLCAKKARDGKEAGSEAILLQAHLGKAVAYMMEEQYEPAALTYDEAEKQALAMDEGFMVFESRRMASYCLEKVHKPEPALQKALQGWELYKAAAPAEREHWQIKPLAEALTRLNPDFKETI